MKKCPEINQSDREKWNWRLKRGFLCQKSEKIFLKILGKYVKVYYTRYCRK